MQYKKGHLTNCSNYKTIALLNYAWKILMMVLLERLKTAIEPFLLQEQAGFRKDWSTVQQILLLRLVAEKARLSKSIRFHQTRYYQCHLQILWGKWSPGEHATPDKRGSESRSMNRTRTLRMIYHKYWIHTGRLDIPNKFSSDTWSASWMRYDTEKREIQYIGTQWTTWS